MLKAGILAIGAAVIAAGFVTYQETVRFDREDLGYRMIEAGAAMGNLELQKALLIDPKPEPLWSSSSFRTSALSCAILAGLGVILIGLSIRERN